MHADTDTPVYDQMLRELACYPGDLVGARKGDTYTWLGEITILVTRVAGDGSWVDLRCHDIHGREWAKRQMLTSEASANPQEPDPPDPTP